MQIKVLGVTLTSHTLEQAKEAVSSFLDSTKQHIVVTPNPEFLVNAQRDPEFKTILNQADLTIIDGIGIKMAARIANQKIHRITGVDFIWDICEIAAKKKKSVFLLGGSHGIANAASKKIIKKYPSINIVGATDGGNFTEEGKAQYPSILEQIKQTKPDILIVALGQIKQEKFIAQYLKNLPSVKVAIGVGGAFDFISGKIPRAPKILRKHGFEWLYRLLKEPRRAKRIADAVLVFPYLIIKQHLTKKFD